MPLKEEIGVKKSQDFKDNWADVLEVMIKIIKEYFDKFEELQDKIGFVNFVVGKKDFNLKMNGPADEANF